jgi:peroxiredoxin
MALPVSTIAPDFTLKNSQMKDVTLSDFRGKKNVVLLFVPAAFTHVCTDELCGVSDGMDKYEAANAEVFGITIDSPWALRAWAKEAGITIPLLSDYQREMTHAYDAVLDDLEGLGESVHRAAFVIDKEGVIRYSESIPTLKLPNFEAIHATLRSL